LNSEMIWKIWKKGKLNSGKIWKIKRWQAFVRNIIIEIPYLGLYNAHWCKMRTPSWPWKSQKKK
jgi:hypothetical protein